MKSTLTRGESTESQRVLSIDRLGTWAGVAATERLAWVLTQGLKSWSHPVAADLFLALRGESRAA